MARRSAILAAIILLIGTSQPARAKALKHAAAGPAGELQARLAGAQPLLEELGRLIEEEARTEEPESLAPRREDLRRRIRDFRDGLQLGRDRLKADIRGSWLAQGVIAARQTRTGKEADVPAALGGILESEDIKRRSKDLSNRLKDGLQLEEESFARAKARGQARERQRAMIRASCAVGGAAALLVLAARRLLLR